MMPVRLSFGGDGRPTTSMRRPRCPRQVAPFAFGRWRQAELLLVVDLGRRLLGDADQRLATGADGLHLHVADAQPVELAAQIADVDGAGFGLHLDQRPALEVDAVIEAARHQQHGRQHGQGPGHADEEVATLDDLPARVVREEVDAFEQEFHGRACSMFW